MLQDDEEVDDALVDDFSTRLPHQREEVERAYRTGPRNVRTVLRRQYVNTVTPDPDRPVCELLGEQQLLRALKTFSATEALFTLARIYDEVHVTLCRAISGAKKGERHNEDFRHNPRIDVHVLADELRQSERAVGDQIVLEAASKDSSSLAARWQRLPPMTFDNLPRLLSLSDDLPGERSESYEYAGIGGGGGSDIISASLLGHLLRQHDKEMNLLVSTRTWTTGSQGKKGSKLGVKREIYNHGGAAQTKGRPVAGTYRVQASTTAEGRDLETIPLPYHRQIFMVLDQGESKAQISQDDQADLTEQFGAVLSQAEVPIETVIIVDTGGDVYGADTNGTTTPDQDYRVQKAIAPLKSTYNLVTAVVAPGVDAPSDAPRKAFEAGGVVYKPTEVEKKLLLDLLANQYRMDGSDPSRFGKTTLALQARLRGVVGWTSLDLPTYVVDTWENPWNSFVYIRECMSDIIFMPTTELLPLIDPGRTKA